MAHHPTPGEVHYRLTDYKTTALWIVLVTVLFLLTIAGSVF